MVKSKTMTVLVCDDDAQDRKLVQTYLRQASDVKIVAVEAANAADIQTAIDKGGIDLIFMDIQMPEKSGMVWLKEIVNKRAVPVVMLTGFGNEDVAVQSLEGGAVGYLPKSKLSKERMRETIDRAMSKWAGLVLSTVNQRKLEKLANVDSLTGLLNRRAVLERLNEQMRSASRHGETLGVLMLDIDHFKLVNDNYGHMTGDSTLQKLSQAIITGIRDSDVVGRYGGEEIMVVLPERGPFESWTVADRLRQRVSAVKMSDSKGNGFQVTVSIGVSVFKVGDDMRAVISRADEALYRAKQNGRDRVSM